MLRTLFSRLSLALTLAYCAVFPGSTIVLALDAVPAWGEWMGGALLMVQGLAVACWALGAHGGRGGAAVAGALLLAWVVEHVGETTGLPFGRYRYTEALQPQILGVVPAPIALAWLTAAFGAWQLAYMALRARTEVPRLRTEREDARIKGARLRAGPGVSDTQHAVLAGALIVALDLQIEPVATAINRYWVWLDAGPYYGVPLANFAAWWAVGVVIALLLSLTLGNAENRALRAVITGSTQHAARSTQHSIAVPALLYLLSSLMFTVVNLARGYWLAGLVGALLLASVAAIAGRNWLERLDR
ncbi:MAG TPA: carotenoid biosynthesis protein [Roseiflexaceae bacterium]|nr:carotenoid biosynthesis protein [Roseiflexaceae bacterium]